MDNLKFSFIGCFLLISGLLLGQNPLGKSVLKVDDNDFTLIKKQNGSCFYTADNKFIIDCPNDYSTLLNSNVIEHDSTYILETYYNKSKNKLHSRGIAYKHCYTDLYEEYSVEGDLILRGQFKSDSLSNENCNVKDGHWIHYINGKETKKEIWDNGMLTSSKGWEPLPIYDAQILIEGLPYEGKQISLKEFKKLSIILSLQDNELSYGRFTCRLMVTGPKRPLKQLTVDYIGLEYFDFKDFITDYWKDGSQLFIEITDTNTNTYFNTYLNFKS